MFQVIHPPYKKVTLACIACLCFEIGVCPWPDLSALFQYTSPTPVVSLHLIPRIQYHPGIPVTLLTGSSWMIKIAKLISYILTPCSWVLLTACLEAEQCNINVKTPMCQTRNSYLHNEEKAESILLSEVVQRYSGDEKSIR